MSQLAFQEYQNEPNSNSQKMPIKPENSLFLHIFRAIAEGISLHCGGDGVGARQLAGRSLEQTRSAGLQAGSVERSEPGEGLFPLD